MKLILTEELGGELYDVLESDDQGFFLVLQHIPLKKKWHLNDYDYVPASNAREALQKFVSGELLRTEGVFAAYVGGVN